MIYASLNDGELTEIHDHWMKEFWIHRMWSSTYGSTLPADKNQVVESLVSVLEEVELRNLAVTSRQTLFERFIAEGLPH